MNNRTNKNNSYVSDPFLLENRGVGGGSNDIDIGGDDDGSEASSIAITDSDATETDRAGRSNGSEEEVLAKKESKAVCHLRILVIFILIACAVAISIVIYDLTRNSEINAFEIQFEGASGKVLKAFEDILRVKLGAVASLTVAMTTHALEQNDTWPFVTLSSFQRRAAITRSLSGAVYLSINHYVTEKDRAEWEKYTAEDPGHYIAESFAYMNSIGIEMYEMPEFLNLTAWTDVLMPNRTSFPMFKPNEFGVPVPDPGPGPYLPAWQIAPLQRHSLVNLNLLQQPWSGTVATLSMQSELVVMGDFFIVPPGKIGSNGYTNFFASLLAIANKNKDYYYNGDPFSAIYLPVFNNFEEDRKAVASLTAQIYWASYFENILPPTDNGIVFVLQSCTANYTYMINGESVQFQGIGDLHDPTFDNLQRSTDFNNISTVTDSTLQGLKIDHKFCPITISVYPSQTYFDDRTSNTPLVVTISVAMTMLFAVLMFLLYDRLVERRQAIVVDKANQTSAIVSSLFPKNVRDRLLETESNEHAPGSFLSGKFRLKSFLNNSDDDEGLQPIADLFPETTVLFADIAGFTAWSSTREPAQVFTLLQTLYQGFDAIAHHRKVFKVETIGDSYVAVTGLPDPQKSHALIMARFAQDCLTKMYEMLRNLELKLGPDTTELGIRFGMHSGPVTAGVLRGERARFQLFGDTVNTAARMESTGHRNKIHLSETTANLLRAAGKANWLTHREDKVTAKGKGLMNTFWLNRNVKRYTASSVASQESRATDNLVASVESRQDRLVNWVCELIAEPLKVIVMRQKNTKKCNPSELCYKRKADQPLIDEIEEVVTLPDFDAASAQGNANVNNVKLSDQVITQLRMYVEATASMYQDNPFHNFEHACHVTMSVSKILKRIVTPDIDVGQLKGQRSFASHVHDYTYGINSDPLALLAIIFSAMIHDVDHRGISNMQLMKEEPEMASIYSNKSVAEQNSLELAWNLLMEDAFDELRACMFQTRKEMMRFRQVLINVVLATDIFDKELNELRKARWQRAFYDNECEKTKVNALKATIVIEHIIQASDVSHTMQHWHVYQKWNKRLFLEMTRAYKDGRMGADPASFWYQGELGFFDNYVIPLAKKLKECGVFGVSSDEFLNYANQNRAEWAERGQEIVADMVAELANPGSPDL